MAKLSWLPKKTFELEFSIPWKQVKTVYDQVLTEQTKKLKLKGFRQGKAPREVVEKSLDKTDLYRLVINHLLPLAYVAAIKQHQLKPAVAPKITIISAEENKAWEFKASSCELPEIKLGEYGKTVRAALAKEKIWTPDKGLPADKKEKELTQSQKLNLISQALLQEIKIELPDLLIEEEQNRLLAQLLNQAQSLGLTIDQYASANNKSVSQLRQEYRLSAENTLKLELILQAIASDKGFKAEDKEIEALINSSGDEKLKKQLKTPGQRAYIASVIKKRQAIDYLLSL